MDFGVFAIGRRLATEPDGGLLIGLGPDVVRLSEFEARWWRQARRPDASGRRPERQEVSAALGLDEFEHYETTDRLYELGVWADWHDDINFSFRHRAVPLGIGLGNSATDLTHFRVGLPGSHQVLLAERDFELWRACGWAMDLSVLGGLRDPETHARSRELEEIYADLGRLAHHGLIYLDRVSVTVTKYADF